MMMDDDGWWWMMMDDEQCGREVLCQMTNYQNGNHRSVQCARSDAGEHHAGSA